jgi:hypothetical protein
MIEYSKDGKLASFNGKIYCKDSKTGYYLNSTSRKRLHREVYEHYNGQILNGHEIHHKDNDKSNNELENLQMIKKEEHSRMHAKEKIKDEAFFNEFHSKGVEKAKAWHSSKEGIEWHREHYIKNKDKLSVKSKKICLSCGKEYETFINGKNKFCSNACKSANRRNQGKDLIQTVCKFCGGVYDTNKYRPAETCSRSCANRYRKIKKQQN